MMTASTTGGSCLTAKGLDISLAALQRQDPYINNIVDVASQVALYTFNSKSNEWEKTDVEGTLFVYTRLASPRHGFTIMNRLSMENLTEPITKDLDFQLQDPFLLYRNARLSIHGIWFYDKTDCQRIAELMKSLTRLEQQLHQQQQCGWVSPRALDTADARGVDILQMLTKARDEYDKGKLSSEPKEIGGGVGVIHDNPRLIKPIPLKPTDRHKLLQHSPGQPKDGDSKPISVVSLFGSQPSFPQSQTSVGSARPGVGGRPAVARSLSYDDPSVQAVPVSPGGGPLLGLAPPPPPSSSSSSSTGAPQPCAAIQKLMSGHRGAPERQLLADSPDKRVCENGLQRGGGGDPLQKLFSNPLTLHPAPVSSSSSSMSAPCCPLSHPGPAPPLLSSLQAGHPVETAAGALHQHPQQHQHPQIHQQHNQPPPSHPQLHAPAPTQPLYFSPSKPLLPTPLQPPLHPLQVSAGVLPLQVNTGVLPPGQLSSGVLPAQVNAGVLRPAQVSSGVLPAQVNAGVLRPAQVSSGVVSPHELLQRLQLVQQEQNQVTEPSRPLLAPCFHQPQLQNQHQHQHQARPTDTSTTGPASLDSNQHFQSLSSSAGPTLLISPSVFTQTKLPRSSAPEPSLLPPPAPQEPRLLPPPAPQESRALSRSQLQATLIHLIQNDDSFLDVIYEAYASRYAKDTSRPRY